MNFNFPILPGSTCSALSKMKNLFIFLTCFLASCGGGGSSNNSPSDLTNSPIAGSWITVCEASVNETSLTTTYDFLPDGTFVQTGSAYFDPACSVPAFDVKTTGIVQESEALELPGRGIVRNINFVTNFYSITPRSDVSTLVFNAQATCMISNWEVGVDYDISSCSNRPGEAVSRRPAPYADYSIYLVERGQLFFGNEISFTAENRPNTLATRPAFIRPTGAIGDDFPEILKGFWVLPGSNQYVELLDQGLIRFYGQTDQGCFVFNFLTLFLDGDDRYQDPLKIFKYTISELDGNLLITSGTDPQVFVYMPSDIPVDQLELCV